MDNFKKIIAFIRHAFNAKEQLDKNVVKKRVKMVSFLKK